MFVIIFIISGMGLDVFVFYYFRNMILKANNVFKSYGDLEILKGVSISVKKGEIVSIVGASGAGKSTLLHIIGTLDKPDKGTVLIEGEDVFALNEKQLSDFRNRHIGFVFQFHHLLPEFTALENVCIPGFIAGQDKKSVEKRALDLLDILGFHIGPIISHPRCLVVNNNVFR
ncbi:Lipoprotein-releasing system ATP-binding protein LolD [Sphingobacterium daejeonense]|nr:Lipoprotein-releasing system ATP-binding protein LolD [Sphingobacterium daejeonense]